MTYKSTLDSDDLQKHTSHLLFELMAAQFWKSYVIVKNQYVYGENGIFYFLNPTD